MLIENRKYTLTDNAELNIVIHHNRAKVSFMVWDTDAHEWFTVFKTAYAWEDASELLHLAIDLAEKYAPEVVGALQELFAHPDFEGESNV